MENYYEINFEREVVIGTSIYMYGTIEIENKKINVVVEITNEFLEDINEGNQNYEQTFNDRKFTIESFAIDKFNKLNEIVNEQIEKIKFPITSEDAKEFLENFY